MFVSSALAARIDRTEARLSLAVAAAARAQGATPHVVELGGGAAVFVRAASPMNKLIGAGFDAPFDADVLARVEAAWAERSEPVRIELSTLASPETVAALSARGYQTVGFENVLVRRLDDELPAPAHDVRADAPKHVWLRTLIDGFAAPDGTGAVVDQHSREVLENSLGDFGAADGFIPYVAWDGAQVLGAATMRIDDGIALLCGATTLPHARRRGVQQALLVKRLLDARLAGCELATVTTAPGSTSQSNVMRSGFALGYVRAVLLRGA